MWKPNLKFCQHLTLEQVLNIFAIPKVYATPIAQKKTRESKHVYFRTSSIVIIIALKVLYIVNNRKFSCVWECYYNFRLMYVIPKHLFEIKSVKTLSRANIN